MLSVIVNLLVKMDFDCDNIGSCYDVFSLMQICTSRLVPSTPKTQKSGVECNK